MTLFQAVLWLELRRLKFRLWGLFFILAGLISSLQLGKTLGESLSVTVRSEINLSGSTSLPGGGVAESLSALLTMLPSLGFVALALFAGLLVLMTAPFRGDEEWRSGGFQLYFMCDHSFYVLEACRYAVGLLLSLGFFVLSLSAAAFYTLQDGIIPYKDFVFLAGVSGFWYFSILLIFWGFGSLMSAVSWAYLHKGRSRILAALSLLGIIQFFVGVNELATYMASSSRREILVPLSLKFDGKLLGDLTVTLPLEWLPLSLILSALLTLWGSRIYGEIEA